MDSAVSMQLYKIIQLIIHIVQLSFESFPFEIPYNGHNVID